MKMPMNYEERVNLVDKMVNQQLFTFEELLQYKNRDMLEYGDLFIIDKDGDYWFSIVFLDNKWYAITGDHTLEEITENELSKYKFYNQNAMGSPYQDFIKRESIEKYNQLSLYDKCDVLNGDYFCKRFDKLTDNLINTFEKLIEDLKEEKS